MPNLSLHSALVFIILLCGINEAAWGQLSSERKRWLVPQDTLVIDSLSLIPGYFSLRDAAGNKIESGYSINIRSATVYFDQPLQYDSLLFQYAVFPVRIPDSFSHKDSSIIMKPGGGMIKPYVISDADYADLFDDSGIKKSGSISRGIAFGNAQNLTVNSALNLQLSGRITDQYSIMASVTDDNIPIQPNGNTQQLQDFDQVFIQIYDDRNKLIAGDFILKRPRGYFVNYFKRSQGLYVQTQSLPSKKERMLSVEASASVSKGRFGRNVIQGIEGNQGPYRLSGADGEPFIIILAGTEAVFIDGKLLERGQDKDYIIDYNAAEIVFTPRQFITKDRRIVVEFQYSERRYARPMLHTAIAYGNEKSKFYLNAFSESDAKNQPLQQDLTQEEKIILANAGDNLLGAFANGVDSVGFNNTNVLYRLVNDSLGFDSVYVFSVDPNAALYRLQFTLVGQGNGDYVEDGFVASGRKFKWVAPLLVDGVFVRQGNYAPIALLTTPKKRQVVAVGHEYTNGKNKWTVEGSVSNNDLNTFSSLNSADDTGFAFRTGWDWGLNKDTTSKQRWFTAGHYEYNSANYIGVERFREVEFDRNWNIRDLKLSSDLQWAGASLGWQKDKIGRVMGGAEGLSVGSGFQGLKGNITSDIRTDRYKAIVRASALQTDRLRKTQFIRHVSDLSAQLGKFRIGFKDDHEWNETYSSTRDSIVAGSYRWYDWQLSVGTADTLRHAVSVYYRDRLDWLPKGGILTGSARADEYGVVISERSKKDNRLKATLSNRRLRSIDPELFAREPENTLLSRLEYYYKAPSGWLISTTFYEIGSGLEQRREFIYLEVQPGQGVYIWNDYNGDGVKDLNEFEVAQFAYEANYIRSSIQSNDYIRTFTNQFSQALQIQQGRMANLQTRWGKFMSRWSDQASYRVERKTDRESDADRFNPFITNPNDTVLISMSASIRNVLFFNKANPVFGADYTFQQTGGKNLLSNGFETRNEQYHQLGFRWNALDQLTWSTEGRIGDKDLTSDFLSGRNYRLIYLQVEPKITWQPDNTKRFSLNTEWSDKQNTEGIERAEILSYGLEFNWNSLKKGLFQGGVQFYRINYNGQNNTSIAFDMLEGLNAGFNATWNIGLQRTVTNNLQLNLTYNGRKSGDIRAVHAGGVQLRAFF